MFRHAPGLAGGRAGRLCVNRRRVSKQRADLGERLRRPVFQTLPSCGSPQAPIIVSLSCRSAADKTPELFGDPGLGDVCPSSSLSFSTPLRVWRGIGPRRGSTQTAGRREISITGVPGSRRESGYYRECDFLKCRVRVAVFAVMRRSPSALPREGGERECAPACLTLASGENGNEKQWKYRKVLDISPAP
ncbi:hypothetical protein AAFF_G00105830 [Aldrovandia affinis]|uniref:Uncharacterized protein n=1 Tax=Aldrovandia affinis TaxID=143900 RepID=A0AAD7T3X6_9TELE|nr:hypothetical protein AAFF_G00105830 [Aldrovandia affinis]